jgi:hypothetical protein
MTSAATLRLCHEREVVRHVGLALCAIQAMAAARTDAELTAARKAARGHTLAIKVINRLADTAARAA